VLARLLRLQVWAAVAQVAPLMKQATGNECNMDILAWWAGPAPCSDPSTCGTSSAGARASSSGAARPAPALHRPAPPAAARHCRYIDPNRGDAGFSPHRDRQPDDVGSTFRGDGSAKYSTCWIPFTDACPENSCLYVLPRWGRGAGPGPGGAGAGGVSLAMRARCSPRSGARRQVRSMQAGAGQDASCRAVPQAR
jgi:hypothetical protein